MIGALFGSSHFEFIPFDSPSNLDSVKDFVRKTSPDMILLDVMMPGIDGFSVCKYLKDDKDTKDIPVIFMSGKNHISDKINALKCGAQEYLIKPFDPFYLEELLFRYSVSKEIDRIIV